MKYRTKIKDYITGVKVFSMKLLTISEYFLGFINEEQLEAFSYKMRTRRKIADYEKHYLKLQKEKVVNPNSLEDEVNSSLKQNNISLDS